MKERSRYEKYDRAVVVFGVVVAILSVFWFGGHVVVHLVKETTVEASAIETPGEPFQAVSMVMPTVEMPELDGWPLVRALKELEGCSLQIGTVMTISSNDPEGELTVVAQDHLAGEKLPPGWTVSLAVQVTSQ